MTFSHGNFGFNFGKIFLILKSLKDHDFFFSKNTPKWPNEKIKKKNFSLSSIQSCPRLLGEHVQKVCKSWPHGLLDYNVWSGKESFFLSCMVGAAKFDHLRNKILNYANLNLSTISMHIMLGTCVPNLRSKGWMEHTQMHLGLKKGTKIFHCTSNSWGIFIFELDQNPNSWSEGGTLL